MATRGRPRLNITDEERRERILESKRKYRSKWYKEHSQDEEFRKKWNETCNKYYKSRKAVKSNETVSN